MRTPRVYEAALLHRSTDARVASAWPRLQSIHHAAAQENQRSRNNHALRQKHYMIETLELDNLSTRQGLSQCELGSTLDM